MVFKKCVGMKVEKSLCGVGIRVAERVGDSMGWEELGEREG